MIGISKLAAILAAGAVIGAAALALTNLINAGGHGEQVRIAARQLEDGRVETALQIRDGGAWGDRIAPDLRYLPADAANGQWLSSSPIDLPGHEDDSAQGVADAAGRTASAVMRNPDGEAMGTVVLTQGPRGVLLQARIRGLSEGPHGFHIHETGACSPGFSAAGDHFNPTGVGHGQLDEGGEHAGDLPNIIAHASGDAMADYYTTAVTLAEGPLHSLFDEDGSAIVIHEGPDSYGADPGAGGRVACGVIALE